VDDVVRLLGATINGALTGRLDRGAANAVFYGSGVLLKALEAGALEDRISALEARVDFGAPQDCPTLALQE
jgi:hypothetical protein